MIPPTLTMVPSSRELVADSLANLNALVLSIRADVWAEPVPERLDIRTELDLETAAFSIQGFVENDS